MEIYIVTEYNEVTRTFDTKDKAERYLKFLIELKGLTSYDAKIHKSILE